jgi:hypothetical protein
MHTKFRNTSKCHDLKVKWHIKYLVTYLKSLFLFIEVVQLDVMLALKFFFFFHISQLVVGPISFFILDFFMSRFVESQQKNVNK